MDIVKSQGENGKSTHVLPEGSLAARAAGWLTERTPEVYLVGGTVRDWLLGRDSHDLDFAVALDSICLARGLANYLRGYFVPLDRRRGIARVVCYEGEEATYIDLTLLQGQTLAQDLMRRDFTINAMAIPIGEHERRLLDPHNGQEDLRQRLIRAVTPCVFIDDPLRLLRAVRLAAELEFAIEPQTEALLRQHAPHIGLSAAERIRYELVRVLRTAPAPRWIQFLADTDLLSTIVPQLEPYLGPAATALRGMHQLITTLKKREAGTLGPQALASVGGELLAHLAQPTNGERCREDILRMAALLSPLQAHEVQRTLLRLRFSGHEARSGQSIAAYSQEVRQLPTLEASRQATYRFFREAGDAGVEALLLALAQETEAQRGTQLAQWAVRLLEVYFHHYQEIIAPTLLLDGHTVMRELGLSPGPTVGELLARLREAQAVDNVHTREQALAFLRMLLSQ
jgi:tRNA nucleotidyltransferase/poly(A) polymerase